MAYLDNGPADPFAGVTEETLTETRWKCERLVMACRHAREEFAFLILCADPEERVHAPGGMPEVVERWGCAHDSLREGFKIRRQDLLAIERGNAPHDTTITLVIGRRPRNFSSAHEAVAELAMALTNLTSWVDAEETLTHDLQMVKEHFGDPSIIDVQWFGTRISLEWRRACSWIEGRRAEVDDGIPEQHRTRPMSKADAAKYLGLTVKNPRKAIDDRVSGNKLRILQHSPRTWIFDMRQFPNDPKTQLAIAPTERKQSILIAIEREYLGGT